MSLLGVGDRLLLVQVLLMVNLPMILPYLCDLSTTVFQLLLVIGGDPFSEVEDAIQVQQEDCGVLIILNSNIQRCRPRACQRARSTLVLQRLQVEVDELVDQRPRRGRHLGDVEQSTPCPC